MRVNQKIRQLETDLIDTLNGADLPIECKRYVLLHVAHLVQIESDRVIAEEKAQEEKGHAESTRLDEE